jgi:hypothetical protein
MPSPNVGSTEVAKPSPIAWPAIVPAISAAASVTRTVRPMTAPRNSSHAAALPSDTGSIGIFGMSGSSDAHSARLSITDTAVRIRTGATPPNGAGMPAITIAIRSDASTNSGSCSVSAAKLTAARPQRIWRS